MIDGIAIGGQRNQARPVAHGLLMQRDTVSDAVETDVALQPGEDDRTGLKIDAISSSSGPHHVGADVDPVINEQLLPCAHAVQHQHHIREFVQTRIDMASSAGHARRGQQPETTGERASHRAGNTPRPYQPHCEPR